MTLEADVLVNEFRVIREIGRGAMGVVYLAEQTSLAREVVLKVLHPALTAQPELLERFRREALHAARLRHASIVPVITAGEHEGRVFIAMDHIEGRSLDGILVEMRERGSPPGPELIASFVRIAIEIAEALHYAHEQGILHRDVKPSNIVLDRHGRPYLTDFGLARHRFDKPLTSAGNVLGTPRYMAPEQIDRDIGPVDERSDVYSLGATLYELLTLAPPFDGKGLQELFARIREGTSPPAASRNLSIPQALSDLLARVLSCDPARRPQTAHELAQELRAIAGRELAGLTSDASLEPLLRVVPNASPSRGAVVQGDARARGATLPGAAPWTEAIPGGSLGVSVTALLLALFWMGAVGGSEGASRDLMAGAYPFAWLALTLPVRRGGGGRIGVLSGLARLAALALSLFVLAYAQTGEEPVTILGVFVAALLLLTHFLYHRWVLRGATHVLVEMALPFLAAAVLHCAIGGNPFLEAFGFLLAFLALFGVTSALVLLPSSIGRWRDLGSLVPLLRAAGVGIPAAIVYLVV